MKKLKGEYVFEIFNIMLMLLLIIVTVYPMYYVFVSSVSDSFEIMASKGVLLLPRGFNLESYKAVFNNPNVLSGYKITLIVLVFGTAINIVMTSICAFLLTRKKFAVRKVVSYFIIFTMFFNGGMIPTYLLVYKWLGLGDTLWALLLPGAINTYNMIIMRSNFETIPISLEEAAIIDGANDIQILYKVILPLSVPIIAVMVLFYGVANWNAWFGAMMYIRTRSKFPLQLILREVLIMNDTSGMGSTASMGDQYVIGESIKYATIVVATLPILFVYPFIQRYFVKGMMIGAVKG